MSWDLKQKDLRKNSQNHELDLLEIMARDMDKTPNSIQTSPTQPPINKNINNASKKGSQECICTICSRVLECPRNLDSNQMESIYECDFYKADSPIQISGPSLAISGSNNINSQHNINSISKIDPNIASDSKKTLISEIMQRWEQDSGRLRVCCKKCEAEMDKILTTSKIFYRCSNYPECKIQADPWYISECIQKGLMTNKLHGDVLVLYQYQSEKNMVFISEIFSDTKLFL